jgi:flagellin-like hook-associated protein FlgL
MKDGASFFVLQTKMRNQVRGKAMALDNIGDAKDDELSLAEVGLLQIDDLLGHMRDIVVRSASDTLTSEQREDIHRELIMLAMAIDKVAAHTKFNEGDADEMSLLGGSFGHTYQVGPNEDDKFHVEFGEFTSEALKVNLAENEDDPESGINVLGKAGAKRSISLIDFAINTVKDQLNELGDIQTRFTSLRNILSTSRAAEESAASRFGNADLAREQVELAKLQLFNQLATAQTARANAAPAQLLGALRRKSPKDSDRRGKTKKNYPQGFGQIRKNQEEEIFRSTPHYSSIPTFQHSTV